MSKITGGWLGPNGDEWSLSTFIFVLTVMAFVAEGSADKQLSRKKLWARRLLGCAIGAFAIWSLWYFDVLVSGLSIFWIAVVGSALVATHRNFIQYCYTVSSTASCKKKSLRSARTPPRSRESS